MAGVAGSERYLESILPALRARGLDISFLIIQHPKNIEKNIDFINTLKEKKIPVHIFNSYFSVSLWTIWKIARLIKVGRFDILYSNLIYPDFMSAVVKKFFIPTLTLLSVKHGYDEKFQTKFGLNPLKLRMSLFSVITKWSALSANKVICISKSLENFFDVTITDFCYPFGQFHEDSVKVVSESGYLTATTMNRGRVNFDSDQLTLPRIPITHHTLPHLFMLKLLSKYEDKR